MARLHDSNCKLFRSIQTFNILCCDFLSDLLALYVLHSMVISLLRNKKHFCRHFDNRSYITSSVAPDPRGSKRTYIIISSGSVQITFSVWLSFRSEQWSEEVNGFRRAGMSSVIDVFVLSVTAFNFFIVCLGILSFALSLHYGHGKFSFLIHFLKQRRGLLIVGGILLLVSIAGIAIAVWLLSGGDVQISKLSTN